VENWTLSVKTQCQLLHTTVLVIIAECIFLAHPRSCSRLILWVVRLSVCLCLCETALWLNASMDRCGVRCERYHIILYVTYFVLDGFSNALMESETSARPEARW